MLSIEIASLRNLKGALSRPPEGQIPDAGLEYQLEQLPYSLDSALMAAIMLCETAQEVVARIQNDPRYRNSVAVSLQDDRLRLGFFVDSYLGAARRAQNGCTHFLSRVYGQGQPSSLADVVSKIGKGSSPLSSEARAVLGSYWSRSGQKLKAYRDLSEHFSVVASDVRVASAEVGVSLLYLTLPNNPEAKTIRNLNYAEPTVHALEYVQTSLIALVAFVRDLSEVMLREIGSPTKLLMMFPFRDGRMKAQGMAPIASSDLRARVFAAAKADPQA